MTTSHVTQFCPVCGTDCKFSVRTRSDEYDVRGERIRIELPIQVCSSCGESLLDPSCQRDPVEQVYEIYRRKKGLLCPGEIRDIRKRYGLSQKSFATLLGMSEATVNRYEGGGLQDDAHDAMIRLCDNPDNMKMLLSKRGDRLTKRQLEKLQRSLFVGKAKLKNLYRRLRDAGLDKRYFKEKFLPDGWDDEQGESPSFYGQLLAGLRRVLTVDSRVLENDSATIAPIGPTCRLKLREGIEDEALRWPRAITARVATFLCRAMPATSVSELDSAATIRSQILGAGNKTVNLDNLLDYCWDHSIPVLHISHFPAGSKKMDGLAGRDNGYPFIALCKKAQHAAWLLFILAHELGHIVLGHVQDDELIVDQKVNQPGTGDEEQQANAFALELLTGCRDKKCVPKDRWLKKEQLLAEAQRIEKEEKVDAGVVINMYAFGQKFFRVGNAALNLLEPNANAPGVVRQRMLDYVNWDELRDDIGEFVQRITRPKDD